MKSNSFPRAAPAQADFDGGQEAEVLKWRSFQKNGSKTKKGLKSHSQRLAEPFFFLSGSDRKDFDCLELEEVPWVARLTERQSEGDEGRFFFFFPFRGDGLKSSSLGLIKGL